MDPNANLNELLELARAVQREEDREQEVSPDVAARMAELILALDGWIAGGGFRPQRWQ